ncbi:MAG: YggT family protein [Gammaproteobacteria bacterium]|mgnify:CR=1 FL=1|jgi:YggT family protein|nr:YggT family protein [Gammaproteobacteria bacterium]MBT3860432.1 YggT family protein [Gammaproteobacteria bacterium]MBT3988687.1 YggT family protein [Gammaproteobacteria bacterium]MBT4581409.1 YggT family protein [Gammaproteobacteria bacterium]MBT4659230.1 YggT family protein [Gammaproteobacteria bacterium]
MGVFGSSAALIFNTVVGIYLLAVLLRFLLQVARADFYNPVSQAVFKITDPMVKIFRKVIPGYRGIDFSSLILAFVVEAMGICALILLYGGSIPGVGYIVTWAFVGVVFFIISIYYYAIIASIIMSFVMMFSGSMSPHPILRLIWQLTEPVMAPIRKVVPPMGGMDFSPIVIFIGIQLIQNLLITSFGITNQQATVIIGI